jgi:hypothetical protein
MPPFWLRTTEKLSRLGGGPSRPRNRSTDENTSDMITRSTFQIICVDCDAVGIVVDYPEDAPMTTTIRCHQCGGPRGTLGDLRRLAQLDRHDLFDVG